MRERIQRDEESNPCERDGYKEEVPRRYCVMTCIIRSIYNNKRNHRNEDQDETSDRGIQKLLASGLLIHVLLWSCDAVIP